MKNLTTTIKTGTIAFNERQNPPVWAINKYFNFYVENLKPLVMENSTQSKQGYHGIDTHTNAVVFRGIDYAASLNKDPMPVVFACAFHDIARTHDDNDSEHAKKAVPIAMKIMKQFPKLFDETAYFSVLYAIMNHTCGKIAQDYISACLWDADRTRLAWEYGFDEKFFNTERGKHVAKNSDDYIKFQHEIFPDLIWSKQY